MAKKRDVKNKYDDWPLMRGFLARRKFSPFEYRPKDPEEQRGALAAECLQDGPIVKGKRNPLIGRQYGRDMRQRSNKNGD